MKFSVQTLFVGLGIPAFVGAQCLDKAKLVTEIKFDNNPEANEVVVKEDGAMLDVRDLFILKARDENVGLLEGNVKQYEQCLKTRSLYSFVFSDLGNNGLNPPAYFDVKANGRDIVRKSSFESNQYTAFFSLDKEECPGGQNKFQLELTFDASPGETTWRVVHLGEDGLVESTLVDYTSSLPSGSTTYDLPEFLENTLYVDACVTKQGQYAFILNDSADDGMVAPGGFTLLVDGEIVASGQGTDFQSTTQKRFFIAGPSSAPSLSAAPTAVASSAPSTTVSKAPSLSAGPSVLPTSSQTPSDVPTTKPATKPFCFSASSDVYVLNKGVVPMREVEIGDHVQTSTSSINNKMIFEPVYAFGHYGPQQMGEFLRISISRDDNSVLELSHDHMVYRNYAGSGRYVRASELRTGDILVGQDNSDLIVQSITSIQSEGVYAPFTPSGTIVVGGVLASTYTNVMGDFNNEKAAAANEVFGFLSFQWIAHAFEFPHRVACHYMAKCPRGSYDENGISTWVAKPHRFARWLLVDQERPGDSYYLVKKISMSVALSICMLFSLCEAMIFGPFVFVASAVGVGAITMLIMTMTSKFQIETPKMKVE